MKDDRRTEIIISTRSTTEEQRHFAESKGYALLDLPMISFTYEPPEISKLEEFLAEYPKAVIAFTSANAVKALSESSELCKLINNKVLYSVGEKTTSALQKAGYSNIKTADGDAVSLAKLIASDNITHVLHLCSNIRRPELSDQLQESDIHYKDLIIYHTHPQKTIPKQLPPTGDYIFFMSPSAVIAFFTLGLHHVYEESIYIAIGRTTLHELLPRNVTTRVAREPSFESMVQECR